MCWMLYLASRTNTYTRILKRAAAPDRLLERTLMSANFLSDMWLIQSAIKSTQSWGPQRGLTRMESTWSPTYPRTIPSRDFLSKISRACI